MGNSVVIYGLTGSLDAETGNPNVTNVLIRCENFGNPSTVLKESEVLFEL